jgi:hypothetical protein
VCPYWLDHPNPVSWLPSTPDPRPVVANLANDSFKPRLGSGARSIVNYFGVINLQHFCNRQDLALGLRLRLFLFDTEMT